MLRCLFVPFIFIMCISVSAQGALPRQPTIDEVATYLRAHLNEPPPGFISYFWIDEEPLHYADINGDGEDDLIAEGWLFAAVMLWQDNQYSAPFQLIYTANPDSGTWSHLALQDWTLDGVLDISFDRREPIHGNDFEGNRYYRSIISCELLCHIAWEGQIAEYIAVASEQGVYLSQSELSLSENERGRVVLDVITKDFAFNCRHVHCVVTGEVTEQDGFQAQSRIGATIRHRYLWDGLEFLSSHTVTLIETHIMPPQSRLSASHENGQFAQITYDEHCQLWLEDVTIGESFACVVDFTQVYWYADYLVLEYAYFTEESLILYEASGREYLRISGAIRDETLFGVRLDSAMIHSAGTRYSDECPDQLCWFTLNTNIIFTDISE